MLPSKISASMVGDAVSLSGKSRDLIGSFSRLGFGGLRVQWEFVRVGFRFFLWNVMDGDRGFLIYIHSQFLIFRGLIFPLTWSVSLGELWILQDWLFSRIRQPKLHWWYLNPCFGQRFHYYIHLLKVYQFESSPSSYPSPHDLLWNDIGCLHACISCEETDGYCTIVVTINVNFIVNDLAVPQQLS